MVYPQLEILYGSYKEWVRPICIMKTYPRYRLPSVGLRMCGREQVGKDARGDSK